MINPLDLHAMADGQLDAQETARLREALRDDPEAAAEYNTILNLKDFLREQSPRHTSEETWKACVGRLDELDRSRRVEGFVRKYAWALCGIFFLCILSGRTMMQGMQGSSVQSADLIHMSRGLIPHQMPSSQDVLAKNEWLDQVLGEAKKAISTDQITVIGGAVGKWDGLRVSQLDLEDKSGLMRLIIVPGLLNVQDTAPMPGNPPVYAGMIGDVNCVAWTVRGNSLILLAPRSHEDLQSVAERICAR